MNITKEKLEQILEDDLLFQEEIEKKQGFILDCFSKNSISIPIEKLLPFINKSYVILFVLEHYKLNDYQIKTIKHFLKEDSKNHLEFSSIDLTDTEKKAILKKQEQLPANTNISLDFFQANFNLIIDKLYNVNKDYDEEDYDDDSTIENIIKNTFKNIKSEDFLKKNNLLKFSQHPFLFQYIPQDLLLNKEIKEHYKKTIFKYIKRKNLKLELSFFRRYKFDEHDSDDVKLLKELISKKENTRYEHYSFYQQIHNFEKIIPLEDYVLNYNLNDFFKLPLNVVQDNKKLIQSFLLSDKSLLYDFDYEYLIYLECSDDIFNTIFDTEFITEICKKTKNIKHHYAEYLNSSERKRRNLFFNKNILNALFENPKFLNKTDFPNIKHFLDELPVESTDVNYQKLTDFVFFTTAAHFLQSSKIINYGSDNIVQYLSMEQLEKLSNEKPSFNLLFLLYLQQKKTNIHKDDYSEIIQKLSTFFDDKLVEKILNELSIPKLPKNKYIINTTQNNFIYEALDDFNKINFLKKYHSVFYSKEVQEYIIKNNIILENNLVLHLIDDKHDFLIDYIKHNKNNIIQNTFLLKKLNNNPNTFKLIEDFNLDYKEQFDKILNYLKNNLKTNDDQTINDLLALIPHNELLKQINSLFISNDFKNLNSILSYISEFDGINSCIYENISKLEFNKLILKLDDDDFIKIIKEVFDSKNTFKNFSDKENLIISEKLFEKGIEYSFILDIFENNTDFLSVFLMKHFPFEVLTQKQYKFAANHGKNKVFSNELIIQGLENIYNQNLNILKSGDVNSRVYDFLSANFKNRKEQFLDLLKKNKK